MHGVDTRLLRKFESEDVDLAGSSYLAHILKLGTSTARFVRIMVAYDANLSA